MPKRKTKYVSTAASAGKRAKSRGDARQAEKQQDIGLLEAKMAPVLPKSYLESLAFNPQALVYPNWTQNQLFNEGGYAASGWWDKVNSSGSSFLQPSDGKCGLLSYRANLGTEQLVQYYDVGKAHAWDRITERAWSTLALPKSKISGKHTFLKNLHLYLNIKYLTPAPYTVESVTDGLNPRAKAIRLPAPARVRILVVKVKRNNMGLPMYDLDEPQQAKNPIANQDGVFENHELDYAGKRDNPVSSNLFLDPMGHPFGVDQLTQKVATNQIGNNTTGVMNVNQSTAGQLSDRVNLKRQPAWMHFSQPVQKKFFDVLSSDTFMLQPDFSQPNSGVGALSDNAVEGTPAPVLNTSPNYPSCKYLEDRDWET
jgi:hypothetical protein